jgi:mannose-1-phosphate guanylyltransferase/mannose-6-phosphate isomerase
VITLLVIPVILCGGAGSRLWPLSREEYPKQLLSLVDNYSLLQNTVKRVQCIEDVNPPILVCNEKHRFLIAEQLREEAVTPETIILEPVGRNTAPALALAAFQAEKIHADSILVVLPSDHVIPDLPAYESALKSAIELAAEGKLVTFGVKPTGPETGYGYIKAGEPLKNGLQVLEFVEKPDATTAETYIASGNYYWNSGMFVFKASRFLEELKQQRPDIEQSVSEAFANMSTDADFSRPQAEAFSQCPSDSIDYAVMEGTESAAMVPLDAGWSDIGSWDVLWEVSEKDQDENTLIGDVIVDGVHTSYVRAEHRLVSVVGLDDVVVVETADAVMITSKSQSQNVKNIVLNLRSCERDEHVTHRKVYRPWGNYENLDSGDRFLVKRISVSPGASLSLQKHNHRAEHWTVVSGVGEVTRDDEVFMLDENESTYIPLGARHRLSNPGTEPLEIIEVQSGEFLSEDDIIRFEDNYGR